MKSSTAVRRRRSGVGRRLTLGCVGLGVMALAATAFVVSYEGLRSLAVLGGAPADLVNLYPAAFDALLTVALVAIVVLRTGAFHARAQAWLVLWLLLGAATAANVAHAIGSRPPVRLAAIGVAAAPWLMLAVALWLWLLMFKHTRAHRPPLFLAPTEPTQPLSEPVRTPLDEQARTSRGRHAALSAGLGVPPPDKLVQAGPVPPRSPAAGAESVGAGDLDAESNVRIVTDPDESRSTREPGLVARQATQPPPAAVGGAAGPPSAAPHMPPSSTVRSSPVPPEW